MSSKDITQYIGVSVVAFALAAIVVVKGGEYFQLQYAVAAAEDTPSILANAYIDTDDKNSVLADTMQLQTDMYAKHLLAANDPNSGCGCPECCAAL